MFMDCVDILNASNIWENWNSNAKKEFRKFFCFYYYECDQRGIFMHLYSFVNI